MTYRVDPSSDVSPSRQLVEAVLDAVATGALAPGMKLLSVRALAAEALVNPNTAARAYRDLTVIGVLEGRNGLGVFVTEKGPALARAAREKKTLDAFTRAAAEALRAGHAEDALVRAIERLATGQPATERSATEQLATEQPATKQLATKQLATGQSATGQPGVRK